MRKSLKYLLVISLAIIFVQGTVTNCDSQIVIKKRMYRNGFYISFLSNSKKHKNSKTNEVLKNEENDKTNNENLNSEINNNGNSLSNIESPTITDNNLTASVDNLIIPINAISYQQNELSANTTSEDCDNIVLKNGEEIKAKVTEITTDEIKYKKCDNLTGPSYSIKKSEVFIIKYSNGTKEVITTANPSSSNNVSNKPPKVKGEKKSGAFGIVSFVTSIVGLIVAGIILGLIAFIFGIIGINRKLKGLAIAGFIIGIIDVIGTILILGLL